MGLTSQLTTGSGNFRCEVSGGSNTVKSSKESLMADVPSIKPNRRPSKLLNTDFEFCTKSKKEATHTMLMEMAVLTKRLNPRDS